jgi:hypothetical protein
MTFFFSFFWISVLGAWKADVADFVPREDGL